MFQSIPSDSFYGDSPSANKELETPKPLDRRLLLKNRPGSLLENSRTWKVFDRQDEALAFAQARGNGLKTFVFHAGGSGTRQFLVAHPREFWLHDQLKEPHQRCSYEVIPEFTPCKLYLDLEFDRRLNPESNGPDMVEIFIRLITAKIKQQYSILVTREEILDLDSTTEIKFSRHLILQNQLCHFANNYVVGVLVRDVCNTIRCWNDQISEQYGISSDDVKKLFVKNRHDDLVLFCDESVYTKNRHFRLYCSTKPHKNAPLKVSKENQFKPPINDSKLREEFIFHASLISNSEKFLMDLPYLEASDGVIPRLAKTPKVHANNSSSKLPSPFPDVDQFVRGEMEVEGIRTWVYFKDSNCLIYDSQGPAFCGNVGRVHKSNKSMLIVNLTQLTYYRKCHDPDCRGYQSEPKSLPSYLVTLLQNPGCSSEIKSELKNILELLESDENILCDDY
ncbi:Hypothetical predicted protein [Cloeon dipterum]|uniref:DNA-directed primase/polymerase protein n=1 Tax=Cloeon dipterum TaxID=197152 RepID=A0A8S1C078_9INSE|nr:Hypothetical predicted protein [Cloeon dipterum]